MPKEANSSFAFHDVIASIFPPVSFSQIFWPIFFARSPGKTNWGTGKSLAKSLASGPISVLPAFERQLPALASAPQAAAELFRVPASVREACAM